MSGRRLERINIALQREIAGALFRIPGLADMDLSTVTVVSVRAAADLRQAVVNVSVRGDTPRRAAVLSRLAGQRKAIQEAIARNLRLKYTPHLHWRLDASIERGDRVLAILDELEQEPSGGGPPDAESR